jgi:hypothetical protein
VVLFLDIVQVFPPHHLNWDRAAKAFERDHELTFDELGPKAIHARNPSASTAKSLQQSLNTYRTVEQNTSGESEPVFVLIILVLAETGFLSISGMWFSAQLLANANCTEIQLDKSP